jgi:hypothetical protein
MQDAASESGPLWVCPWGSCNQQQAQECRAVKTHKGCGGIFQAGTTLEQAKAFIAPRPTPVNPGGIPVVTLPPLAGLQSAWEWFVTDHENGGHAASCGPAEPGGCHCGFDNLRRVIARLGP